MVPRRQLKKVKRTERTLANGDTVVVTELELVDKLKPLETLSRGFPEFAANQEHKPDDPDGARFDAAYERMPPEQHQTIARQILEYIPLDVAQQALIERAKRGDAGAGFPAGGSR